MRSSISSFIKIVSLWLVVYNFRECFWFQSLPRKLESTGVGIKIITINHYYQPKKRGKINQIQPKKYILASLHNYSSSESPSLEYPPPPLLQPETLLMLLTLEIPPGRSKWATLLISCRLLPLELVGGVVGHIIVGLDRCRWWWWSTPPLVEPDPVAPTLEVLVLNGATELCLQNRKNVKFSIHKNKDLKEPQRTSNVGATGLGFTSGGALHHPHCHRSSPTMICPTTPSTSSSGRTYHSQARPVSVVMVEYPTSTVHWWSLTL
jgi:hypothetical protein